MDGFGLSPSIHNEIFKVKIETPKENVFWSLGFGLKKNDNSYILWHWGHNVGFRAYFLVSKESKSGFVYFTNSNSGLKILKEVSMILTGSNNHPSFKWF